MKEKADVVLVAHVEEALHLVSDRKRRRWAWAREGSKIFGALLLGFSPAGIRSALTAYPVDSTALWLSVGMGFMGVVLVAFAVLRD